jgi:hypothetical protein
MLMPPPQVTTFYSKWHVCKPCLCLQIRSGATIEYIRKTFLNPTSISTAYPNIIQMQLGPAYVEQNHNGEGQKANLH